MDNKKCPSCLIVKPPSEYYYNKNIRAKNKLSSYCRSCSKEKSKEYCKTYHKTERGAKSLKKTMIRAQEKGYYRHGKGAIPILRQGAIKRGISFELTAESLSKWWEETDDQCFYCKSTIEEYLTIRDYVLNYNGANTSIRKFQRFYRNSKHKTIKNMTIDRAKNDEGYTVNNIVKSCWICNSIKSDFFTADTMGKIAKDLINELQIAIEKESSL
jgi:hypothetical protein